MGNTCKPWLRDRKLWPARSRAQLGISNGESIDLVAALSDDLPRPKPKIIAEFSVWLLQPTVDVRLK